MAKNEFGHHVSILLFVTLLVLARSSWQQQHISHRQGCPSKEKCDECIRSFGCVWCTDPNFSERRCQPEGDSKCPAKFTQNPRIEMQILRNRPLTVVKDETDNSSINLINNNSSTNVLITKNNNHGTNVINKNSSTNKTRNKRSTNVSKNKSNTNATNKNKSNAANVTKNKSSTNVTKNKSGTNNATKNNSSANVTNNENKSSTNVTNNKSSANITKNSETNLVQISPQAILLKLRPNEGHAYRVHLEYRQAQDYPVDLYYLMDLSFSMKRYRDKLSLLGDQLAATMTKLTSNFRIGFGGFVDKPAAPFVTTVPLELKNLCTDCVLPYGFRNFMKLSNDTSSFAGHVKSANVSKSKDDPEGGFDAIMQAAVCRDEIGWREDARKLLIFSTTSTFHHAGDGKLAGVMKPSDGCCHLDQDGLYTYTTTQDYPSVSQINQKMKEYSINLIFAITPNKTDLYQKLSKLIEGSSCGALNADSSNVVELVKDEYEKITSSIELREKNLSSNLRVRYFTKCLNASGPLVQTNKCDGLRVGQTVEFEIEVELLSCPKNRDEWTSHFSIHPVGVEEELVVDVEMLCDCAECSAAKNIEKNSSRCSRHGTLKCGMCECDAGFSGENCSCKGEAAYKTDRCRPDNTSTICSGHGACKCNKCVCSRNSDTEVFWGDYCQCNNFSCPRVKAALCAKHGDCVCGKCVCQEGWTGNDCTCDNSTTNCVGFDGKICSGHGTCRCNKCSCGENSGYVGKYCEKCPSCSDKCADLKSCVECKVHNSGPLSKEECEKQCDLEFVFVDFVEVKDDSDVFCMYSDERNCQARFTYRPAYSAKNQKSVYVTTQKNKDCPRPQALVMGVVFQLIAGIVFIGLAFLVIWKIITSAQDRREYAKFEKEIMMAKWDAVQNPIFIPTVTTYQNPMYGES